MPPMGACRWVAALLLLLLLDSVCPALGACAPVPAARAKNKISNRKMFFSCLQLTTLTNSVTVHCSSWL